MEQVQQLLTYPPEKRDLVWIKQALQSAIELEHATLPLYLGAMFSLETQNYTTYNSFRSVAMEEMVHMAIACNLLAIIGGKPQIKNLRTGFPSKGLPGGAEPDLETIIASVSKQQLSNFMRLESPVFLLEDQYQQETYPSISNFYRAIQTAITAQKDTVIKAIQNPTSSYSNQIGDDIGFRTFQSNASDPIAMIFEGIEEIIQQGEGTINTQLHAEEFQGEESHYCKFAEIYYQARYKTPEPPLKLTRDTLDKFFHGYPIKPAQVVNTLAVPTDGYAAILKNDPAGDEVKKNLEAFDLAYSDILSNLDKMWNGPANQSWPTFGKSVGEMTQLRVLSCFNIMKYEIPESTVQKLEVLYPNEYELLAKYTDFTKPVYYGPRFLNMNAQQ